MIDNATEVVQKIKEITDYELKLRLIAVAHLVDQRKQLDKDQEKEIREVEKKYNQVSALFTHKKIFLPLYTNVNQLVNGERLPTPDEAAKVDEYLLDTEKDSKESYLKVKNVSHIN